MPNASGALSMVVFTSDGGILIGALRGPAIRKLVESGAVQLSLFDEQDLVEVRTDA